MTDREYINQQIKIALKAARLEGADITVVILEQVRAHMKEEVMATLNRSRVFDENPPKKRDPDPNGIVVPKGIWKGRTTNATRPLRENAVLTVLCTRWSTAITSGYSGPDDGWMTTREVLKSRGVAPDQKGTYILRQLLAEEKIECRIHLNSHNMTTRLFEWRCTKSPSVVHTHVWE